MLKSKVLKRLLPILLSIAMVVTSMPMDSMAAENATMEMLTDLQGLEDISIAADSAETGTGDGDEEIIGDAAEIIIQDISESYYNDETGNWDYFTVVDDYNEKIISTIYDEAKNNPFRAVVNTIKNPDDDMVIISTDGQNAAPALKEQITTQWQVKGADGTYADMADGEVPAVVGEYKLVLSIDKKYAVAEPVAIDFVIEKAQLYVTYNGDFNKVMKSGAVVKDVKESFGTAFGIKKGQSGAINAWYSRYVNEPVITIKDTFGTEALADDFVMKLGGDYTIYVETSLKEEYQANYELIGLEPIDIKITELKETTLNITNNVLTAGSDILRTYTGKEVVAPVAEGENPEITVVVTSDDEMDETTGAAKVIAPAAGSLTMTWLDANGVAMEKAPVDAGAYYYQVTYTDAEGIYEESSDRIRVIVEPAELVVKPVYSATDKVFAGSGVNRVLENVTYELYSVDEAGKETPFTEYDEETFWGVSYNNPDKAQSYMPVFTLQQGIAYGTGDGEDVPTTWRDVTGNINYASGATKIGNEDANVSYRVVFSGKKALYKNGQKSGEIDVNFEDVNSANRNYTIDTSVREDAKNVAGVEILASANATIDVTEMLIDGKGDSVANVYTKIYDAEQLYADRKEYKKASVKNAEGKEIAADTDSSLTYRWYRYYLVDKLDDKGEVVLDEKGNAVKEAVLSTQVDTSYSYLPSYAGQYCLKVSYYDSTNEYYAESAYVYFEIEKQLVKVVPIVEPTVYAGTNIGNFISMNSYNWDHKIYMVPGNDVTLANDKLVEMTELKEWNDRIAVKAYNLDWTVLVGDSTKPEEAVFTEIADEYGTVFDKDMLYKLGAKLNFTRDYSEYYSNYTNNYEVVVEEETITKAYYDTVDITVKEMGDIELEVRVDESKLETNEKVYDGKGFDLTAAVEAGYITVVKANTDEVVPITGENALAIQYSWESYNEYYDWDEGRYDIVSPKYAREYTLSVKFEGDDTYQPLNEEVGTFTIREKELVITPYVNDVITAGLNMNSSTQRYGVVDTFRSTITGYIPEDADIFGSGIVGYSSILDYSVYVTRVQYPDQNYYGYLRYGQDYRVEFDGDFYYNTGSDWDRYGDNYVLIFDSVEFTPNKRGNSSVSAVETSLKADYAEGAVSVMPLDGVPYVVVGSEIDVDGDVVEEGNYFFFNITAPKEFIAEGYSANYDKFIYKNNVEAAGGYVVSENRNNGQFQVAFLADAKDKKEFVIRWEDGYTETYTVDMTNADLLADLTNAVAPKKLSFNGVNRKMTVGETQALDVKVTKNISTDVVYLNYEVVSGTDVVSITQETGVVTALKKGSATVAVYPVRWNKDGEFEKIAGFKAVTTKITVADVTAPKISSAYAYDYKVVVKYPKPADGYRREIYILPGKGIKATEFESKIAAMGNGTFEGIMQYAVNEATDEKGIVTRTISGLNANSDYTVYVRNVSGIRTLEDGSEAVASFNGSTKSFKTTKVQINSLEVYLSEADQAKFTYNWVTDYDEIKLSEKSVSFVTEGRYTYKPSESAADAGDNISLTIPLDKTQQATYMNPKMKYAVLDSTDWMFVKTKEYSVEILGKYYKPSKIASVDKKGTIKFKGIGPVYFVAWDTVSEKRDDWGWFNIVSDVTKVSAKKQTIKTGSAIDVYEKLTFYNGKAKLKVSENFREDNPIKITSSDYNAVAIVGDTVVAMEPDKTVTLTISLRNNPSVTTTMQIQTKALEAVKKLKVTDIVDDEATVTFTHSGNADYMTGWDSMAFKVALTDAKGNLMRSDIMFVGVDWAKSNPEKNVFAYQYTLGGLSRQSSYTVSVAPIFNLNTTKAASKKFKTTNIPASYYDLRDNQYDAGMSISVTERSKKLSNVGYLTSGNTYTLVADANPTARDRKTDTLTWKSTNPKVASIKANTGSFTATLKAVKAGSTVIEVKSKVTKKVIARWIVRVKTVSNAEGQYGNTEPVNFLTWDIYYDGGIEVLTEVNPVRFTVENGSYDYKWVSFTAPADGIYRFGATGGSLSNYYYFNNEERTGVNNVALEENQTIYLKANGAGGMGSRSNVTVTATTVEKYGKVTIGQGVNSNEYDTIRFTAPTDNYYTFYATEPNLTAGYGNDVINLYHEDNDDAHKGNNSLPLRQGQTVELELINTTSGYEVTVKGRSTTALTEAALATGELKAGEERWFTFTAPVAGNYTFASAKATGMLKADYYSSIMNATKVETFAQIQNETFEDTNDFSGTLMLDKDETVVLRVYTESETAVTAELSVSKPVVQEISLTDTAAKVVSIPKEGEAWVSFVVPEDDTEYTFNFKAEEGKVYNVTAEYYRDSVDRIIYPTNNKISGYKAGTVIYIKLTTDSVDDAANVSVSVKATTATELTEGKAQSLTVEDGGMYFFTFTAPSYGLYTIQSQVADGEGAKHTLRATEYSAVNANSYIGNMGNTKGTYDFYVERMFDAGEEIIFAVSPYDATDAKTTANIIVNKVNPTTLPTESATLKAAEAVWYKYTATCDDTFKFEWNEDSTANVYYSKTWRANIGNTMYNGDTLTMSEGDTVYFKVNNGTNAETTIKFNVTSATPDLPTKAFTVKAGESNTYKYVVAKAARYKVTYSAAEEGANVDVYWSSSDDSGYIGNGEEIVFDEVGKTIIFTVYSDSDATVTMKVQRIVPIEYTDKAITVKANDATWVEYVVPATGRYSAALTAADGTETTVAASYNQDILTDSMSDISYLNEKWLTKGQMYYIRLNNYSETDLSVKLSVKEIEATELTAGAEATTISLNAGDVKWYRFKAAEGGYYNFTTEIPVNIDMDYYYNTDNNIYGLPSGVVELKKGDTYLIKVYRGVDEVEGSINAVLGVAKEEVLELTEGTDLTVTTNKNDPKYVVFKAPSAGYYGIRLKDIPEGVVVSTSGLDLSDSNVYVADEFAMSEKRLFAVSLLFETEDETATKSVKLSVEKIVPQALTDTMDISVDKGVRAWFEFVAPEDGRYTFSTDSSTVNVNYALYDGSISDTEDDNGILPVQYPMYKDQKYIFAIYYDSVVAPATEVPASAGFEVSVNKLEPATITADTTNAVAADSVVWYSYTPSTTGEYVFDFKEVSVTEGNGTGDGGDVVETPYESVYFYNNILSSWSKSGSSISVILPEGKTVYFRVTNDTEEQKNIKMVVEKEVIETIMEGVEKTVTFTESGDKWLAFKALSESSYCVRRTDGASGVSYVRYYNNPNGGGYYSISNNSYRSVGLEAEAVIYIKIGGDTEESTTILIENAMQNKGTMVMDTTYSVDVKEGCKWLYTFTAPETAYYEFYSDNNTVGDPYGELYSTNGNYLSSNYDSGEDNNFWIKYYMSAGQTVVLRASGESSTAATYDVHVRYFVPNIVDAGMLEVDETHFVDVESGSKWRYTFVAPETAEYIFYSDNNSGDPRAELHDAYGNVIGDDDDGGDSNNFQITHELTGGETYYLYVFGFADNAAQYDVHVEYYY